MQCFVVALKGQNTIAQGEASPWRGAALGSEIGENIEARKGRHKIRDLYCALSELANPMMIHFPGLRPGLSHPALSGQRNFRAHSLTHLLTYSLTHLLTYSLTHLLT
ncbi:MAG TPA: hypothetical protein VGK58_18965, partial [Lacipirellulaceae bacterium]